jgi:hypothetical protein
MNIPFKNTFKITVAVILLGGCVQGSNDRNNKNQIPISQIDTNKYAIIPFYSYAPGLFKNYKPATINQIDIDEIEILLQLAVVDYRNYRDSIFLVNENDYLSRHPGSPKRRLPEYLYDLKDSKRQVVAVKNEKGEKEVFVNCFCNYASGSDNWKKRLVPSDWDNHKCRFSLRMNLSSKTYSNINEVWIK